MDRSKDRSAIQGKDCNKDHSKERSKPTWKK